jgi:hypothetical protein
MSCTNFKNSKKICNNKKIITIKKSREMLRNFRQIKLSIPIIEKFEESFNILLSSIFLERQHKRLELIDVQVARIVFIEFNENLDDVLLVLRDNMFEVFDEFDGKWSQFFAIFFLQLDHRIGVHGLRLQILVILFTSRNSFFVTLPLES